MSKQDDVEQKSVDSKDESSKSSLTKDNEDKSETSNSKFFGVKSYIHNFYEQVTLKDPKEIEQYDEYRYLMAPKRRKYALFVWRLLFWLGLSLLLIGSMVLFIGYLWPRHDIVIGYQEEMEIIDKNALTFNQILEGCKFFGLGFFSVGGTLLSATLLLPTLIGVSCIGTSEDGNEEETTPFKLRIGSMDANYDQITTNNLSESDKIPATEEITSVQPRREQESVMTGTGLAKLK